MAKVEGRNKATHWIVYAVLLTLPVLTWGNDVYNNFIGDVYLLESKQARIPMVLIRYSDDEVGPLLKSILDPHRAKAMLEDSLRAKHDPSQLQLAVLMGPLLSRYPSAFGKRPDLYESEYLDCIDITAFLMTRSLKSYTPPLSAPDSLKPTDAKELEAVRNLAVTVDRFTSGIAQSLAKTLRDQIDKHMFTPAGTQHAMEIILSLTIPTSINAEDIHVAPYAEPSLTHSQPDATPLRRRFLDSRVAEYRFAKYLADCCTAKLERVGSAMYPEEARGKTYGTVSVRFAIRADGSVESAQIVASSGYAVLDRAALATIKAASPFLPFPPEVSRDTDVIEIVRPLNFKRAD